MKLLFKSGENKRQHWKKFVGNCFDVYSQPQISLCDTAIIRKIILEIYLDSMKKYDSIAKGDQKKFLSLYEQTKTEIANNPEMLYKNYWKKRR